MNIAAVEPRPTSCDGCGACCMNETIPPYMPNELDILPAALRAEVEALERAGVAPGAGCAWLDKRTMKCLHYEERPEVCRQFELASEDCLTVRRGYVRPTVEGLAPAAPPQP
jgi:Fe-S-cluster containining protein